MAKASTTAVTAEDQEQARQAAILAERALIAERIRVARERMAAEGARRHLALSNERKAVFLAALTSGILILDAAEIAGVSTQTLYKHRRNDPEFAAAWDDANEASCQPIEQRLEAIALTGSPDSMATVRAAEVTLKHRANRRYQNSGGARIEMKQGADGGSLSVRVGTPGLD